MRGIMKDPSETRITSLPNRKLTNSMIRNLMILTRENDDFDRRKRQGKN